MAMAHTLAHAPSPSCAWRCHPKGISAQIRPGFCRDYFLASDLPLELTMPFMAAVRTIAGTPVLLSFT